MYELEHEEPDFTSHLAGKYVSSECFNDAYLKEYINENGKQGVCTYSKSLCVVMPMTDFMSFIRHRVLSRFTSIEDACLPTASSWFDDDDEDIPALNDWAFMLLQQNAKNIPKHGQCSMP